MQRLRYSLWCSVLTLRKLKGKKKKKRCVYSGENNGEVIRQLILAGHDASGAVALVACMLSASRTKREACRVTLPTRGPEQLLCTTLQAAPRVCVSGKKRKTKLLQGSFGCVRASQAGGSKDSFKVGG